MFLKLFLAISMFAAGSAELAIPSLEIAKGVMMPLVGVGTWQYNNTVAYKEVCDAFKLGYTYVDTAWLYENQEGVGQAIRDCWKKPRSELFVMTKIPGGLSALEVLNYTNINLKQLNLSYVDHLMLHYPCDFQATPARCNPEKRKESWMGMEMVYAQGLARSIGVSHYCAKHLKDILSVATIKPSINQVEYHVGSGDVDDVIQFGSDQGIFFQSFSPLCGPCNANKTDSLISGPLVTGIAKKYNVSGAQVSLKYIVQQAEDYMSGQSKTRMAGIIPKSDNPKHLQSNADLFGFRLSDQDMATLKAAKQPAGTPGDCQLTTAVL